MLDFAKRFASDERGATAIEYGLIAALIAVALMATLNTISTRVKGTFTKVSNAMPQ